MSGQAHGQDGGKKRAYLAHNTTLGRDPLLRRATAIVEADYAFGWIAQVGEPGEPRGVGPGRRRRLPQRGGRAG